MGQGRNSHVVGEPEVVSFSDLLWGPRRLKDLSAWVFMSNRVSSKYSLLSVLFKPEFVSILPCPGAASFKVDIKIFNRRNKL